MKNQHLKELAKLATPWPWKWFTSNSHNRLSSVPSGKDGDVISAFKAADGAACVSISQGDMAFIEAAHPGAVIELIERLEAAEKLAEFRLKSINSMDALVAGRNNRIAKLESWVRGVEEAMISATNHAAEAERERDDLRAELKRRDAAAGEPVGLFVKCGDTWYETDAEDGTKLYIAAPPAVPPPEMETPSAKMTYTRGHADGWNDCRSAMMALGAQPQKPVAEVEELSMQIRRLVHSLKNSNPDSSLLKSVPDYMQRKGYWKATDCLRGEHD